MAIRPRLHQSDLETIAEALDFYIQHLEKWLEENPKKPDETYPAYQERTDKTRSSLMGARTARVQIERNLKGLKGRTHAPWPYLMGRTKDLMRKRFY